MKKKKDEPKVTRAAAQLIEELCDAAKIWGWEEDQGSNQRKVEAAERAYEEARLKMRKFISRLQYSRKPRKRPRCL